jgi:hypothetical protein
MAASLNLGAGLSTLSGGTPTFGSTPTDNSVAGLSSPLYLPSGTSLQATQPPAPQAFLPNGQTAASAQAAQDAANSVAFYQDQINQLNGQLPNLDNQLNVGLGNLNNSYNQSANRLDQNKAAGQRDYTTQTTQNEQSYGRNRSNIIQNTGNQTQALQRLLGIAGAGNSSAAYEQAPYAAGLQGTQQLSDAQSAYGNNGIHLDTAWQDTLRQYNNAFEDLNNDKYSKENALRSGIDQSRASLLGQIGQANANKSLASGGSYAQAIAAQTPYRDQVNSLLNSITQLGQQYANPVLRTDNVAYSAPTLAEYLLNNGTRAVAQSSNPGTSAVDPTFAPLLNQQRDEFGNIIQS